MFVSFDIVQILQEILKFLLCISCAKLVRSINIVKLFLFLHQSHELAKTSS